MSTVITLQNQINGLSLYFPFIVSIYYTFFFFTGLQEHVHCHYLFLQGLFLICLFFNLFTSIPFPQEILVLCSKMYCCFYICILNYISGIMIFHFIFIVFIQNYIKICHIMCKSCLLLLIASWCSTFITFIILKQKNLKMTFKSFLFKANWGKSG